MTIGAGLLATRNLRTKALGEVFQTSKLLPGFHAHAEDRIELVSLVTLVTEEAFLLNFVEKFADNLERKNERKEGMKKKC